jgi:hypothetical protein
MPCPSPKFADYSSTVERDPTPYASDGPRKEPARLTPHHLFAYVTQTIEWRLSRRFGEEGIMPRDEQLAASFGRSEARDQVLPHSTARRATEAIHG